MRCVGASTALLQVLSRLPTRLALSPAQFIVLACDGVWDVMDNEGMNAFMERAIPKLDEGESGYKAVAEKLLDDCLERNSRDNMCVPAAAPQRAAPWY